MGFGFVDGVAFIKHDRTYFGRRIRPRKFAFCPSSSESSRSSENPPAITSSPRPGILNLFGRRKVSPQITLTTKQNFFRGVPGSPFRIWQDVRIVRRSDDTVSEKFIGRKGMVIYLDYSCGCGQSYPNDPMIGVLFSRGVIEEFWREELRIIKVELEH